MLMGDPDQAAHLLGKLIAALGPGNVLWGTDSIWYGSPQDQIDAFRTFEITAEAQERFGYAPLTTEVKAGHPRRQRRRASTASTPPACRARPPPPTAPPAAPTRPTPTASSAPRPRRRRARSSPATTPGSRSRRLCEKSSRCADESAQT